MEDFFLDISYKNKTVRFKVVNPEAPLSTLVAQGSVKRIRLSLIIMCIMGIWCI